MTLQVARGLFRLWLVLSVLWIGGVGVVTWPAFDPAKLAATKDAPYTGYFDPDAGRQPRTVPTASTIVRASTASTSELRNAAEMAGATTVHVIIRQTS